MAPKLPAEHKRNADLWLVCHQAGDKLRETLKLDEELQWTWDLVHDIERAVALHDTRGPDINKRLELSRREVTALETLQQQLQEDKSTLDTTNQLARADEDSEIAAKLKEARERHDSTWKIISKVYEDEISQKASSMTISTYAPSAEEAVVAMRALRNEQQSQLRIWSIQQLDQTLIALRRRQDEMQEKVGSLESSEKALKEAHDAARVKALEYQRLSSEIDKLKAIPAVMQNTQNSSSDTEELQALRSAHVSLSQANQQLIEENKRLKGQQDDENMSKSTRDEIFGIGDEMLDNYVGRDEKQDHWRTYSQHVAELLGKLSDDEDDLSNPSWSVKDVKILQWIGAIDAIVYFRLAGATASDVESGTKFAFFGSVEADTSFYTFKRLLLDCVLGHANATDLWARLVWVQDEAWPRISDPSTPKDLRSILLICVYDLLSYALTPGIYGFTPTIGKQNPDITYAFASCLMANLVCSYNVVVNQRVRGYTVFGGPTRPSLIRAAAALRLRLVLLWKHDRTSLDSFELKFKDNRFNIDQFYPASQDPQEQANLAYNACALSMPDFLKKVVKADNPNRLTQPQDEMYYDMQIKATVVRVDDDCSMWQSKGSGWTFLHAKEKPQITEFSNGHGKAEWELPTTDTISISLDPDSTDGAYRFVSKLCEEELQKLRDDDREARLLEIEKRSDTKAAELGRLKAPLQGRQPLGRASTAPDDDDSMHEVESDMDDEEYEGEDDTAMEE